MIVTFKLLHDICIVIASFFLLTIWKPDFSNYRKEMREMLLESIQDPNQWKDGISYLVFFFSVSKTFVSR